MKIKFTIKLKISLLSILPMLVIFYFSINSIAEDFKLFKDINSSEILTKLSVKMSAYVHETQKERGMTAGFISSKGLTFKTELPEQRLITDNKLNEMREYISTIDLNSLEPELLTKMDDVQSNIDKLIPHRQGINNNQISVRNGVGFYTKLNANILNLIYYIGYNTPSVEIRKSLIAYSNFLYGKENAGVERAVLSSAFAKDSLSLEEFKTFNNLVVRQNIFINIFLSDSSPAQREIYNKKLEGNVVNEVQRLRDIAYEKAGLDSLGNVDVKYWFDTITKKMNLLLEVELRLIEDFYQTINNYEIDIKQSLIWNIVLTLILITIITLFSIYIIINIYKPILAIKKVVQVSLTEI